MLYPRKSESKVSGLDLKPMKSLEFRQTKSPKNKKGSLQTKAQTSMQNQAAVYNNETKLAQTIAFLVDKIDQLQKDHFMIKKSYQKKIGTLKSKIRHQQILQKQLRAGIRNLRRDYEAYAEKLRRSIMKNQSNYYGRPTTSRCLKDGSEKQRSQKSLSRRSSSSHSRLKLFSKSRKKICQNSKFKDDYKITYENSNMINLLPMNTIAKRQPQMSYSPITGIKKYQSKSPPTDMRVDKNQRQYKHLKKNSLENFQYHSFKQS